MMKVLTPIAGEVWRGICQLFEFYLYTVNMFFSRDLLDTEQSVYTPRLRDTLTNIYSTVVLHEVRDGEQGVRVTGCVREAILSPGVQLEGGDSLHGLSARVVGVESTVFLASQLTNLRHHLATLQAIGQKASIQQEKKKILLTMKKFQPKNILFHEDK